MSYASMLIEVENIEMIGTNSAKVVVNKVEIFGYKLQCMLKCWQLHAKQLYKMKVQFR